MTERSVESGLDSAPAADKPDASGPYRVLARTYRPATFADLIGQEAMVRTLRNAISSGRLAHAFILTGVRGVGKTTTARILARALNCSGPDGQGEMTADPCGQCEHCLSIAQDRHVDVIEMDAASRTGIDDIRELIEGVRYRPVSGRYKVYIIDEIHMLSRQAFNGLLKTLEEPPDHVIFIFATTEIRKLPVTVLSRCQRFDLRRVTQADLAAHFAGIAERESVSISEGALAMIARAADGSVRDGLSLLDQAIALAAQPRDQADGPLRVEEQQVKDMLGLADRTVVFDLFEAVMAGRIAGALDLLSGLYESGADPVTVLQDLLELTHFLTRAKLISAVTEDPATPEAERVRGRALAETLSMAALARAWQMLLKGLGEIRVSPKPLQAAEMILIRLAYASELPTPGELVTRLEDGGRAPGAGARDSVGTPVTAPSPEAQTPPADPSPAATGPKPPVTGDAPFHGEPGPAPAGPRAALAEDRAPEADAAAAPVLGDPQSWVEVVALARSLHEAILANHLERDVHLVRFEVGRIEIRPTDAAPRNLAGQLGRLLNDATERRWMVSVSSEAGETPLQDQRESAEAARRAAALHDPLVQAVIETFPGAKLESLRDAHGGDAEADDRDAQAAEPPPGAGPDPAVRGDEKP